MQEVIKKLKFKDSGIVLHAPADLEAEFTQLGFKNAIEKNKQAENTIVFFNNKQELVQFLQDELEQVAYDSVLWFAYPKGSSKIKTDINRDSIMATGEEYGITTVTAVSVNDTWSALRFRPIEKVGT